MPGWWRRGREERDRVDQEAAAMIRRLIVSTAATPRIARMNRDKAIFLMIDRCSQPSTSHPGNRSIIPAIAVIGSVTRKTSWRS